MREHVGDGNQGAVRLSSPLRTEVQHADDPPGASGRTKRGEERAAPTRGSPTAPIGQQQTLLFWFWLNNTSHPRRLTTVTFSNRSRAITRLFCQTSIKQQLFYLFIF